MGCRHIDNLVICSPSSWMVERGRTTKLVKGLRGDVVKTNCCGKKELARDTNVEIRHYEWYGPDFIFTCRTKKWGCGAHKKWPGDGKQGGIHILKKWIKEAQLNGTQL